MGDDEKKTSLESATALAESITKFLAATKSAENESTSEAPPTEAADAASWVRKKYDSMIKWMLGVFASIGLLIFGSVPFLGVAGNILQPLSYAALTVAGVGLTVIIYAATAGYEPQDASLGELQNTFEKLEIGHSSTLRKWLMSTKGSGHISTFRKWLASRKGSRNKASAVLKKTLERSTEASAHLGPNVKTVGGLIRVIGTLETELLRCEVGDAGLDIVDRGAADTARPTPRPRPRPRLRLRLRPRLRPTPQPNRRPNPRPNPRLSPTLRPRPTPAAELVERRSKVFRESAEAYIRGRNEQLIAEVKAIIDVRSATPALPGDVLGALNTQMEKRAALLTPDDAMALAAGGEAAGRRAALSFALDRYLDHRALVLQESAVAQLRGNFRRSRKLLIVGALITTAGGVLYAGSVTQNAAAADAPATGTSYPVVQLTVPRGTDSWDKLGDCRFLETTPVESVSAYKLSDTKFVLDGPDCAGSAVELKVGEFTAVPS